MSTDPILDTLQQQLTPATIQQMSRSLGSDPATTSNAISLALPALLAGLSRNASNPQGAESLDRALNEHGSILDNLGGFFGSDTGGVGGAILGHIFGSRRAPVEQGVGRATGLDPQQVARLLAMLAPIVMAVLGRMKQSKGINAAQLPEVLRKTDTPGVGSLSTILDSNNDGSIADDVARIGSSVLGGFFKRP